MLKFTLLPRLPKGCVISKIFLGSFRVRLFFLLCVAAATLAAQTSDSDSGNTTKDISAASQFFDHDFVNFFVYGNGVWDSRSAVQNVAGSSVLGSALGWEAGGGVTLTHTFRDGGITLNYRGAYRDYQTLASINGEQQNLSLSYEKRLNRRWTFGLNVSGAILGVGSSYYAASSLATTIPGNSVSTDSRFANVGLTMTYAQTRRLSYLVSGNFLINSYNYSGAIDTRGVTGAVSALYRVTARTTIGANYSHTNFWYSRGAGNAGIDSASLTLSHQFPEHWQLDLSAGVNRSHTVGTVIVPVQVEYNGQLYTLEYIEPYNRTIYSPAFQGSLSRLFRHSSVSVSGGQSIMAGNGIFLTSRDQFANGTFSFSTRHSNFSVGGAYTRLISVSNQSNQPYSYYGASASYGVNLVRYVSANARWDLIHYDNLYSTVASITEQRVSFGLSLSTKSVPLTLF